MKTNWLQRLLLVIVGTLAAASSAVAEAGFLSDFTGRTEFVVGNAASDGLVNFAVYENTDGDWTDDFVGGSGGSFDLAVIHLGGFSSAVDAAAKFVYFYQVVNTDPTSPDDPLDNLLVPFPPGGSSLVTSAGRVTGFVFDDNGDDDGGAVGPSGNERLGDDMTGDDDATPGDATPGLSGVVLASPFFVAHASAKDATGAAALVSNFLRFSWSSLETGEFSSLVFITSGIEPRYDTGVLKDTGTTDGDIPAPVPEPGTLALLFAGAPLGLYWLRRRKVS